jgi:hypothetical protein
MSPSRAVKGLDSQVRVILRKTDLNRISAKERGILSKIQQNLNDARIYSGDYELSETREEQLANAKTAKKWLEQSRKNILIASESNFFSAIEVAHLTAQIDQIISELK